MCSLLSLIYSKKYEVTPSRREVSVEWRAEESREGGKLVLSKGNMHLLKKFSKDVGKCHAMCHSSLVINF